MKRYAVAIYGVESGNTTPLMFYRFRSLRRAVARVSAMNDERDMPELTRYVVWDTKAEKIAGIDG